MTEQVDSYRFLDGVTKRMVKTWVKLAPITTYIKKNIWELPRLLNRNPSI